MITWTDEMAEQVRYLREVKGMTFRQIGVAMGGLRKSQVVAKYHRMTGQKNEFTPKRNGPRVWDTNGGNWDTRTFLPYAEWKMWHRNRKKETEDA